VCYQLPTLVHTEYEAGQKCVSGLILVVHTGFEAGWWCFVSIILCIRLGGPLSQFGQGSEEKISFLIGNLNMFFYSMTT